jgi:hypothetical protein
MAVYLYYQLQYYIASPNDTTTRMMWSQNNPAPFPINFSCAGRSFRPKLPVGNFRKLPHLGFCAAPTGCMALNHYSNLTASSRACTAQMHALGYSNETRCAFLKHGETVCPPCTRNVRHTTCRVRRCVRMQFSTYTRQHATCAVHRAACSHHECNGANGPLANDR